MKKIILILLMFISAKCFSQVENNFMQKNTFRDTVYFKVVPYSASASVVHLGIDTLITSPTFGKLVRKTEGGSTPTFQQTLTAGSTLTGDNTIVNDANTLEITGNTIAGDNIFSITSTSTAAAGNLQKGLNISLSGANATASQSTFGGYALNTHTGTNASNFGWYGEVQNGLSSSAGIKGVATTQTGVWGQATSGNAVLGSATSGTAGNFGATNGIAIWGDVTSGTGGLFSVTTGLPIWLQANASGTNDIVEVLRNERLSTGTPANGIGVSHTFKIEASDNATYQSAQIASTWTDVTVGTRTGNLQFWTTNSTTSTLQQTIAGNGGITMASLAGTGSRAVLADANGLLSAPVSDRSVKRNINSLDYGLDKIMALRPVSFYYKLGWENFGQGKQIGFIAQDIQKILPNSTFITPSTGKMGYNETDIVPILVKAVQEQQAQIEQLKKEISKLKKNN